MRPGRLWWAFAAGLISAQAASAEANEFTIGQASRSEPAQKASTCEGSIPGILRRAYPEATEKDGVFSAPDSTWTAVTDDVVCKVWPARAELALVAVPLKTTGHPEESSGLADLEILAVDSAGELRHRHREVHLLDWDAIEVSSIRFDTAPYRLAPDVLAFGLRVARRNSSRANPFSEESLRLYVPHGRTLQPVLSALEVEVSGGEWDTNCAGKFHETSRTVAIGEGSHHGFADLIVREQSTRSTPSLHDGSCKSTELARKPKTYRLSYDGSRYALPDGIEATNSKR